MRYEPDPQCETCKKHGECICVEDDSREDDYREDYSWEDDPWDYTESCGHIAIVSISDTETQCMDCLRTWNKEPGFKSDFPEYDRG